MIEISLFPIVRGKDGKLGFKVPSDEEYARSYVNKAIMQEQQRATNNGYKRSQTSKKIFRTRAEAEAYIPEWVELLCTDSGQFDVFERDTIRVQTLGYVLE
jgi:hypothetical protein